MIHLHDTILQMTLEDDSWSAPFDNDDCSTVTPVPYGDLHNVSPYVATPQAAIDLLLSELSVTSSDLLVDLGCGVGSINITAARRYNTPGVGVDIDPDLIKTCEVSAKEAGMDHLVTFRVEDVEDTDLSEATVVVSFLVPRHLKLLKPKLLKFLSSGGRLACYHYPLQGVTPHKIVQLKQGMEKNIYIYRD